jgi:hypothetical protein
MSPKEILTKLSEKGSIDCSSSGCPLYELFVSEEQLNKMYKHLTKKPKDPDDNEFSFCSEVFLQLCYEYNKKRAKEMFDKYVDDRNNFYVDSINRMPCFLLKKMTKFILQKRKFIDIE